MKNIELPIIHLNGSGKTNLTESYLEAYTAVTQALEAVQRTGPHGRDYYVSHDPDALSRALEQHRERCKTLFLIAADLLAICEHVSND
jgi:hypothetical protein